MKNVYRCSERKVIYNSLLKEHVNHKDKTHIVYEQSEHNLYSQCLYQFFVELIGSMKIISQNETIYISNIHWKYVKWQK